MNVGRKLLSLQGEGWDGGGVATLRILAAVLCICIIALTAIRLYPKAPLSTRYTSSVAVYDTRGQLLRLTLAKDDRYRLWLPLASIAPDIVEAFLLQEDRWFYKHPGVNPLALARGGWRTYLTNEPRQGGSTITMQLARLIERNQSRSIRGKIKQIARALALEAMYSKREILEAYLNLVPYGANIEGVGAASLIHFGKSTQALSLPETLTLAVIPQAPAKRTLVRAHEQADGASLAGARLRLFDRWLARYPASAPQAGLMKLALNLRTASQLPFQAPHAVIHLLARDGNHGSASREIQSTLDLRLQRTLEEWPAGPQHNRQREHNFAQCPSGVGCRRTTGNRGLPDTRPCRRLSGRRLPAARVVSCCPSHRRQGWH